MSSVRSAARTASTAFVALMAVALLATPALATTSADPQVNDIRAAGSSRVGPPDWDSERSRRSAISSARHLATLACERQGRGDYVERNLEVTFTSLWYRGYRDGWVAVTEGTCSD